MGIKQLYNDNLRQLPNEYGDVSVMLYKANHLKPLSQLKLLGEFAKVWFGKNFPVAVN